MSPTDTDHEPEFLEPVDDGSLGEVELYLEEDRDYDPSLITDGGREEGLTDVEPSLEEDVDEDVESIYGSRARNNALMGGLFGLGSLGHYAGNEPVWGTLFLAGSLATLASAYRFREKSSEVDADWEELGNYSGLRNERSLLTGLSGVAGAELNPVFWIPAAYYGLKAYSAHKDYKEFKREEDALEP